MFKTLVNKVRSAVGQVPGDAANWREEDYPPQLSSAEAAADMLRAPTALMRLSLAQADFADQMG